MLSLTLLLPAAAASQHFPPDEELTALIQSRVEDGGAMGIVLGVVEADGSTRIVSYGDAGHEARPLGSTSVFEIGSITKVFTGILLSDMVERGEVALSDPVSKHLPDGVTVPSRNGRQITLLDLTTHRSSITRMPTNMIPDGTGAYRKYTIDMMYEFLSTHELRRDIGVEFEYSNNRGGTARARALPRRRRDVRGSITRARSRPARHADDQHQGRRGGTRVDDRGPRRPWPGGALP